MRRQESKGKIYLSCVNFALQYSYESRNQVKFISKERARLKDSIGNQLAPSRAKTTLKVFKIMTMSFQIDQFFIYHASICALVSKSTSLLPLTCQMPVIPGKTAKISSAYRPISLCSYCAHGRGPTMLISPFRTLISCGSSSSELLRKKSPSFVMRGSCSYL